MCINHLYHHQLHNRHLRNDCRKEKLGIKNILGKVGILLLIYIAHIIDVILSTIPR